MAIGSKILILVWVLQLTAHSAIGMNLNITDVMTVKFPVTLPEGQMTTPKASSPLLQVSDRNVSPSTTADTNPIVETTQTQTKPSNTVLSSGQTAATTTISILYRSSTMNMTSTRDVQIKGRTLTVETASPSKPTTGSMVPPLMPRHSTQNTEKILTFQPTKDKKTQMSTHQAQSTYPISTTTKSSNPTDKKSTSPVPGQNTKTKKWQDQEGKNEKSNEAKIHGKVVTGLIVGALTVMMAGFLVIFIKKRRLQKKQITTTDWAGPSPFLEGAAENYIVAQRPSNRISLASLLPQRMSRRLSLLPETDEELHDRMAGTTFGDKHQGISFDQEVKISKEKNGTAVGVPENKSTGDAPENDDNSLSVTTNQEQQVKSPQVTT